MNKIKLNDIFKNFEFSIYRINEFIKNIKETINFDNINFDLCHIVDYPYISDSIIIEDILKNLQYAGLSDIIDSEDFSIIIDSIDTDYKNIDIVIEYPNDFEEIPQELTDKLNKYFEDYFNNNYNINVEIG
jgi:hypothetical protein